MELLTNAEMLNFEEMDMEKLAEALLTPEPPNQRTESMERWSSETANEVLQEDKSLPRSKQRKKQRNAAGSQRSRTPKNAPRKRNASKRQDRLSPTKSPKKSATIVATKNATQQDQSKSLQLPQNPTTPQSESSPVFEHADILKAAQDALDNISKCTLGNIEPTFRNMFRIYMIRNLLTIRLQQLVCERKTASVGEVVNLAFAFVSQFDFD
jgi:hypothetical protein